MVIFLEPILSEDADAFEDSLLEAPGPQAVRRTAKTAVKAVVIHPLEMFCRLDFIWLSPVYGVKVFGRQPKESAESPEPEGSIRPGSNAN